MGFFSKLREGLRSVREKLSSIGRRKDIPPDARKDIAKVEKKVEALEREARPQERIIRERESVEPSLRRYSVSIQYRPVSSFRAYREHKWSGEASSITEAIALAEESLEDEPDYYLAIEGKREE